jgi:opacity protein-like surface antigen
MRIRFRVLGPLSAVLMLLLTPSIASADITAFLGINGTPSNRAVKGFAVGAGVLIAGFEFEYADTNEDLSNPTELAPGLRTYMFNGLLQTPFAIAGFQPYATAGGGVYHETLSVPDISETNFGINVGGGVKMNLAGPLRLRFDYRVLSLKGNALHPTVQRFYAGVNLKF